ncbi:DHHC family palmitoyltransferase [Aspergillus thermomutatus]|uniref:Palmitoyltransferase n=1 Tax=Aspergillus thermomutatus TaxID=41047 RepID=A0A397HJ66_ASPTH|nr:palmitoyltransferase for Vac8p [Aspergillus thermomutatus]RHZ63039.1 palmitoyltransferase for Vac8p [Aspergillus thermomutatus]
MATLATSPPTSPSWPKRRPRAWALRCERYCCAAVTYFPLAFVYSLTTWAVYVEASTGLKPSRSPWIGLPSTILGVLLYICLNISYTVAVFTDPGSPLTTGAGRHQYSALPVTELPEYTAYTVNSTGGSRFCKKCQCPKPDRAHHCSTCKRCVLKMDHHCPWLATCVGLYNYKAFLLFLVYTSLFCWVDFAVAATWIWTEVFNDAPYLESMLPVNVVLLAILGGIIGLVLTGFTAWHISLAVRGMTTIECLEKTRYVSPLRKALDRHRYQHILGNHGDGDGDSPAPDSFGHRLQDYGQQILEAHANAIPGVTRAEEGEERLSPAPGQPTGHGVSDDQLTPAQQALTRSFAELERQREHDRYQDYLNEEDNGKLPHAFDLGWRKNLLHLFGNRPLLWPIPVCTTTGDGWRWEPSRKFLEAQEGLRLKREQDMANQQHYYRDLYSRNMNNSRAWLGTDAAAPTWNPNQPLDSFRNLERPATGVSMQTLAPMSPRPRPGDSDFEDDISETDLLNQGSVSNPGAVAANGAVGRSRKPDEAGSATTNRREDSSEWRDWD